MPTYKAPVDDVKFLLNEVFHIDRYANLPGFSDASPDVVEAILGEAAKFCEQVLTPLNRVGRRIKRARSVGQRGPREGKQGEREVEHGQ